MTATPIGAIEAGLAKMVGTQAVAVDELEAYLPHRAPAIWVDQVLRYGEDGGECLIRLSARARYAESGTVRASSHIEWVAQSFGYAIAAWHRAQGTSRLIARAYLVSITQMVITQAGQALPARDGEACLARAMRTHQMGPVSVISGEVVTRSGVPLSSMRLKIFGQ